MVYSIRNFNMIGERFWNEGEYADSHGFVDTMHPYVANPYASQENNNKCYAFPSDAQQQHYYQRKPVDCGSIKLLANNISHLAYQKCRTLAVLNGPGSLNYKGSDRDLVEGEDNVSVVDAPYARWTSGLPRDQYKEIGWSQYSSRRLGPFFGVLDRKFKFDDTTDNVNLANNASCIRKMILVVSGRKLKTPTGGTPADYYLRIHVVVTSDGACPANPSAGIIPLSAEQRAWVKECDSGGGSYPEGAIPWSFNTEDRAIEMQGYPAYTINIVDSLDGINNDLFVGNFKVFIPVDCIGNITRSNASYNGVELFQYYVNVGWIGGSASHAITSITLLEVRDPGSAEAS